MARSRRQKRREARAKRKQQDSETKLAALPALAETAHTEHSSKKVVANHAEEKSADHTNDNPRMGRLSMSLFLSVSFLFVASVLAAIAVAHWQKASYRNYWIAFEWGIAAYLVLGIGLFLTYYSYVIRPAKEATKVDAPRDEAPATQTVAQLRPYVEAVSIQLKTLEAEKQIVIDVTFDNEGNTPATDMRLTEVMFSVGPQPRTKFSNFALILGAEIKTILPHKSEVLTIFSDFIVTDAEVKYIKKRKLWLSVYGKGEYLGLGGPYPVGFCSVYLPQKGFADCQEYLHVLPN